MKITNQMGLPKQFKQIADTFYQYKDKQYSVTSILNSTREVMLKRRYNDEIEQDVSDMIWALMGQGLHSIMQNYKKQDDEFTEEKLIVELDDGYKLSGIFDLYSVGQKLVTDYKTTSTWTVIYKSNYEEWRKQLLIYAWMIRKIGFECDRGQIIAMMRDWQKSKAQFDHNYPQTQVQVFAFEFTNDDFNSIEKWIKERFEELKKYENVPDEELPECSAEDRWNKGNKYAVKKSGNKRALKLYDDLEQAKIHVSQNPDELEIEVREGEDTKCLNYCSVNKWCLYYQKKYGSVS